MNGKEYRNMEGGTGNYRTFTELTDTGPYITKLILELPCEIGENDVDTGTFHVYMRGCDRESGDTVWRTDRASGEEFPVKGYPAVADAYPCDENGARCRKGRYAALEMKESYLNKRIVGNIYASRWIRTECRVTQLRNLPGTVPVNGLVFDRCTGDMCPGLKGWQEAVSSFEEMPLSYGYYTPEPAGMEKNGGIPLVLWLHGAGEGGRETRVAYTGNKVTALSSAEIQRKLGGAAWILAPQCPTVWMDDGKEKLGRSNESIYVRPLKALLDEFISARPGLVDRKRIYIGGLSNGGFMTVRMLRDFPDFFAGAIPVCEPFFQENFTEQMIEDLKKIPIWFVHAKGDRLVPPAETSLPLYHRLKQAGAGNVHFTLFNSVEDLTGKYKEPDGRARQYDSHGVWIQVYNDFCDTDLDGSRVMEQGMPVTVWEWLGCQKRERT